MREKRSKAVYERRMHWHWPRTHRRGQHQERCLSWPGSWLRSSREGELWIVRRRYIGGGGRPSRLSLPFHQPFPALHPRSRSSPLSLPGPITENRHRSTHASRMEGRPPYREALKQMRQLLSFVTSQSHRRCISTKNLLLQRHRLRRKTTVLIYISQSHLSCSVTDMLKAYNYHL